MERTVVVFVLEVAIALMSLVFLWLIMNSNLLPCLPFRTGPNMPVPIHFCEPSGEE